MNKKFITDKRERINLRILVIGVCVCLILGIVGLFERYNNLNVEANKKISICNDTIIFEEDQKMAVSHIMDILSILNIEPYEKFYIKDSKTNINISKLIYYIDSDGYATGMDPMTNGDRTIVRGDTDILLKLLNGQYIISKIKTEPKIGDTYYYYGCDGTLESRVWVQDMIDMSLYALGNCFLNENPDTKYSEIANKLNSLLRQEK